jgi:hypothetical protein
VTVTAQTSIKDVVSKLYPELAKLNTENSYSIFIKPKIDLFEITLYSQNTHVLTLFKLNLNELENEIAKELIDKKILLGQDMLKIKVFYK